MRALRIMPFRLPQEVEIPSSTNGAGWAAILDGPVRQVDIGGSVAIVRKDNSGEPNRAVWCDEAMASRGRRSALTGDPMAPGDLFAVLNGPIYLIGGFGTDPEGRPCCVGLDEVQAAAQARRFGRVMSGLEVLANLAGGCPPGQIPESAYAPARRAG